MIELLNKMDTVIQNVSNAMHDLSGRLRKVEKLLPQEGAPETVRISVSEKPVDTPNMDLSPVQSERVAGRNSADSEEMENAPYVLENPERGLSTPSYRHSTMQPTPVAHSFPIAKGHATGAAHLRGWDKIERFFDAAGIRSVKYVMEEERKAGQLRVYGYGEGEESANGDQLRSAPSPAISTPSNASTGGQHISQDALWGSGFTFQASDGRAQEYGRSGGLNLEPALNVEEPTIRRRLNMYLKHIYILHPILDDSLLKSMVNSFIDRYSPYPPSYYSPFPVPTAPASGGVGMKRKRSFQGQTNVGSPDVGGHIPGPRQMPERSINNAIVLLVVALGAIAEHADYLPGVPHLNKDSRQRRNNPPPPAPVKVESPTVAYKPSPAPSYSPSQQSTMSSTASPIYESSRFDHRSRASSEGNLSPEYNEGPPKKNTEVYPGLAYYALATDILGNHNGGTTLPHVQAFLLAGLYMGQLARVLESYMWIQNACRVLKLLVNEYRLCFPLYRSTRLIHAVTRNT